MVGRLEGWMADGSRRRDGVGREARDMGVEIGSLGKK